MDEPLVTLHLWGVPTAGIPRALARMALDRPHLARSRRDGVLTFWKLLGTGDGRTFTVRDADPRRWGVLAVWDDAPRLDAHPTWRAWRAHATSELAVTMRPLASRGTWAARAPFGDPVPRKVNGQVASITRARIHPRKAATFWRAVPPVSADLRAVDGLRLAVGIGEAPVGLQGTFSLWDSGEALRDFAHRRPAHTEAIAATAREGWYAEELFARFEVLSVTGCT